VSRSVLRTSRWLDRAVIALVTWLVVVVLARLLGSDPDLGLLALTVAAAATTWWLCLDATRPSGRTPDRDRWDRDDDQPLRAPGEDTRLAALTRIVDAHFEARAADDTLQRHLMTLADQRLMARHGVSWRVDPDRAAPLLGPELLALARQTRPFPRMSVQQIDVLLSRIEAL
jgi:hypothetical protein